MIQQYLYYKVKMRIIENTHREKTRCIEKTTHRAGVSEEYTTDWNTLLTGIHY